jgi:hypothetical protein
VSKVKLREGGTTRIYDGNRWHVAIGGAYICDGGHRRFEIRVWNGSGRGYVNSTRDFTLFVPKLSFHRAFKLRWFGALFLYRIQTRVLRRLALRPKP